MDGIISFLTDVPGISIEIQLLLYAVSFIGSALAGALGLGGGALVLAVMALFFPPAALIPLHGVVQLGSNMGRAVIMAREVLVRILPIFVLGTAVGALAGAKLVVSLPVALLQTIVALFILYAAWGERFKLKAGAPSQGKFLVVGTLAAFTTMFVGATGPLIAPFVRSACENRVQVVATHAALMTIQHGFKIVAFGLLGFAFWPYAAFLIIMLMTGFIGTVVGRNVLKRMPEHVFRICFSVLLTLLALRLLWVALPKLFGP